MTVTAPSLLNQSIVPSKEEEVVERDNDLLTDVREDLAELFLWWYGKEVATKVLRQSFNRQGRVILCTLTTETSIPKDIPAKLTEDCWQNKWFPVDKEHEKEVDGYLLQRFGSLLDPNHPKYECVTNLHPDCLWETLALIVLFDQVSRCIYRGTPQAFGTDQKALHFALELIQTGSVKQLPLHFLCSVLICLSHSEDEGVQDTFGHIIRNQDFSKYLQTHERIANALKLIYRDNLEKVDIFGRFPERNTILNRESTVEEQTYMTNVVDREPDMKDLSDKK
jgi:uncharacterized protein (DUF924 family)